ncbi:hypothetical protein RND59_03650 [Vibrio ruber]|uniref:hypothetical protein n=1 Tax=Vibrio ruber TaxID=184755 RepID=UPI0028931795|nr:hypothetical protein [Vibrio ruber]WNJ96213.1 hypothetical protein RND59_03650 [Vibrio ruber]
MVQWLVVQLSIWALISTDLPLVSSLICICWLLNIWHEQQLLLPVISEPCRYTDAGILHVGSQQHQVERVELSFAIWFVIFVGACGKRQILWRDSCRDHTYRQLLVMEKRRRYHLR